MQSGPTSQSNHLNKISWAGLLISVGIVFGDIGTSPLYTFSAIIRGNKIDEIIALGSLSCIFWTLTFQTSFKYIIITLKADNKGEGGIFSLFALVRNYRPWLVVPAIMGGSFLLADGIITPPISVSSAIEGLKEFNAFQNLNIIPIVIGILIILFSLQSFGTQFIGRMFGPVMLVWFSFIGIVGTIGLSSAPWVLKALNPWYAWQLLDRYPGGFWLLGGVFLCTTGAEALYSDMGHCGRNNIRVSWIYIKITLILSYAGQTAWLVRHQGAILGNISPFYAIVPHQILGAAIVLATFATIIASQALISGSFTLISEAMRLYLWPRMKIVYPTDFRGQMFVPAINWIMMAGCIGIVLHFRESKNMEAAFGLAVTLTMLMSTILINTWLYIKRVNFFLIGVMTVIFLTIETGFLIANLKKFPQGGWISILLGFILMYIMFIWHKAKIIKNRLTEFEPLADSIPMLRQLSNDQSIGKYATNLIYLTGSNNRKNIETNTIYSIFNRSPKRADVYWFIHVNVLDEPYATRYNVEIMEQEDIVWINFNLGFRIEPRLNYFFRIVVEELVKNKEIDITSRYASLSYHKIKSDFNFVIMRNFLSHDNDLPWWENFIMQNYFIIRNIGLSEQSGYGLDTSNVTVENVPLILNIPKNINLLREKKGDF